MRKKELPMAGREGSILIFTIWLLLVLSILAVAVGFQVRQRLRFIQHLEIRDQLRTVATAGVHHALNVVSTESSTFSSFLSAWGHSPKLFRGVPVGSGHFSLQYRLPEGDKILYGFVDEESKININSVKAPVVLERLLEKGADVSDRQAEIIAASILDWRDEDESSYEAGAESRYYSTFEPPYKAKNKPFDALEELLFVKGVTPEIFDKIRPYLTLSGSNTVNINTATKPVLVALGFSESLADKVGRYRMGRDFEMWTKDDRAFASLGTIVTDMTLALPLNDDEKASLEDFVESGVLTVSSNNFTVKSAALIKGRHEMMTLTCLIQRGGGINRCAEKFGRLAVI